MTTIEELLTEYARLLDAKPPEYFKGWRAGKTGRQIAEEMFAKVKSTAYRTDWLAHNSVMREACKKFGIRKSSELRALVKGLQML